MLLLRKKLEKIVIFHHFLHIFRDFRKIEKILQVQIFFAFFTVATCKCTGDHGAIMGRSWGASAPWSELKGGTRKMGGFEVRNAKTKRPMMTIRRVCMTIGWQSVDNFMTIVMFYNWNVHGNRFFKKRGNIIKFILPLF